MSEDEVQKLAAYRLESPVYDQAEDVAARAGTVRGLVRDWLQAKGAANDGTYLALDRSDAIYVQKTESHEGNTWEFTELVETSEDGRRFIAGLSITTLPNQVVVYGTLEVGVISSQVNVVTVDPRCPAIVRSLLAGAGPWHHGSSLLSTGLGVSGFEQGEQLATHLLDLRRRIPIVVVAADVSVDLARVAGDIAYDLAGLANVVTTDSDASWALTDRLGLGLTCHSGAVRLYWPGLSVESNRYRHPLWTADRILGASPPGAARAALRRKLRRDVMSASAASVIRPEVIDQIRAGAATARLRDLRESAESLDEWKALAEEYAADNDSLRVERGLLEEEVSRLSEQVRLGDSDRAALIYQLRSVGQATEVDGDEIEPDFSEERAAPKSGEVRFYKKQYSAPTHDILIQVPDCGHNSWQAAAKAEKAKKGVAKLEGASEWRTLQHCSNCTGGGMWRVRW